MKTTQLLLCFVVLLIHYSTADNMHIINFDMMKCNSKYSPITLEDVFVDFGSNKKFLLAGHLITDVNLTAPLKVEVELKKHVGFWIPVPCEKNIGSCTYEDVCQFGYPENKKCPAKWVNNHVPCRCPIAKGEYTLPKTISFGSERSVYTGKYKGTVVLSNHGTQLACYNVNFEITSSKTQYYY